MISMIDLPHTHTHTQRDAQRTKPEGKRLKEGKEGRKQASNKEAKSKGRKKEGRFWEQGRQSITTALPLSHCYL
jgi:hypothetical protein